MRIEFFGNVLINKNTTYIYGDRAEYNGELNEARVYSDIVKVVDGDATLYTYRFVFNTKENIGQFADGGVLINRDNRLESVRGYYYANTKDLVCVDRVEMRNDEYELKGDSVVYNAYGHRQRFFFENTNIWNKDGDYLYADRGAYDKADTLYRVTRNGYVLTEKQEMWSDSIDYFRAKDHVVLWRDIQIDDTEHKVLAFGDYGEYWKEPGDIFLTRRPSVVSYDLTQGDSLFMRADSMFLFTVNENARRRAEEAAAADSLARMGGRFPATARFAGAASRWIGRDGRPRGGTYRARTASRRRSRFARVDRRGGFARRRFRLRFADAWFAAGGFVAHGRFALRAGQPARLVGQGCRYADRCPAQGPAQGGGAQGQRPKRPRQ